MRHQPSDIPCTLKRDLTALIVLQVAELCAAGGVPLNTATNRDLAASLAAAEKVAPDRAAVSLIKSLATRAMSEAQYFSTGALPSLSVSMSTRAVSRFLDEDTVPTGSSVWVPPHGTSLLICDTTRTRLAPIAARKAQPMTSIVGQTRRESRQASSRTNDEVNNRGAARR